MIRLYSDTVRKGGGGVPLIGVKLVAPKYFPPKITQRLPWKGNRVSAVRIKRLTAKSHRFEEHASSVFMAGDLKMK
jgi:hypothetical protein